MVHVLAPPDLGTMGLIYCEIYCIQLRTLPRTTREMHGFKLDLTLTCCFFIFLVTFEASANITCLILLLKIPFFKCHSLIGF